MGLLSWLFPHPSRRWPAPGTGEVTLDLREGTVAGVALGAPSQTLERLGRPSRPDLVRKGVYTYPLRGFEVDAHDIVAAFGLVFHAAMTSVDREPGFTPCRLRVVRPDGVAGEWSAETTEEDVRTLLGPPHHERSSDDDEDDPFFVRTLGYAYTACQVSLEFDGKGRLVCIDVDPLSPRESP